VAESACWYLENILKIFGMEIAYRGLNDAILKFLPTGVYPKFYAILH
jgi:hypothetical protein